MKKVYIDGPANEDWPKRRQKPITVDLENAERVGNNIQAVQEGNLLILVINTSKTFSSDRIASTDGFADTPGGLKLNLYLRKTSPMPPEVEAA